MLSTRPLKYANWLIVAVCVDLALCGLAVAYVAGRQELYIQEMHQRYRFKAYNHGQLFLTESGEPLLFATEELARQYEEDNRE